MKRLFIKTRWAEHSLPGLVGGEKSNLKTAADYRKSVDLVHDGPRTRLMAGASVNLASGSAASSAGRDKRRIRLTRLFLEDHGRMPFSYCFDLVKY